MPKKTAPKVFISYSWDSETHKQWVAELGARLRKDGVDVTLDQWHAVPGDQLPEFMEREIRENDFVLIICTPNYKDKSDSRTGGVGYEGDIITAEVLTKGNHSKFIPLLAKGIWDEAAPSWLKGKYYIRLSKTAFDHGYKELLKTLYGRRPKAPPLGSPPQDVWTKPDVKLRAPYIPTKSPFMAEDLPEDFVFRPEEFNLLINQLLDMDKEEPLAITAALRGAGGYGKTTLAKALCHDERIQNSFDDGILWVTLGEKPGDVTGKVQDLIYILSGERPGFSDLQAASSRFAELLADRDILLVVDDVWNSTHLKPFLQGGVRCSRLITTRNSDTLPAMASRINLDAMNQKEASSLLGFDLPSNEIVAIKELSNRLGEWPLLLKLANAVLRERVNNRGQSLADAIAYANRALDKRGLDAFNAYKPEDRNQAVSSTLSVSLELLSNEEQARFGELAIFPEDTDIPLETVEKLWQHAGFDDFDTESLCERLAQLSLLLNFDLNSRQIRLHDVVRSYLRTKNSENLVPINTRFLDAYECVNWVDLPAEEPFLWKYLAYHLSESRQKETLKKLLLTYSWLNNKLAVCDVNLLLSDYNFFSEDSELQLLQSALRLSSNQLAQDKNQLTGHLLGRLICQKSSGIETLIMQAVQKKKRPWLRPVTRSLTLPGGPLLQNLDGHNGEVTAVAISPDGKTAVSASADHTLKVWDIVAGKIIHNLQFHISKVTTLAISPDGKTVVSGSFDKTLKVWDLEAGELRYTMEGHSSEVTTLAISPDGKTVVSGSGDHTLMVWDMENGKSSHTLEGHSDLIHAVAISPDAKWVVSGSKDKTLKVWDLASGQVIYTLEIHSSSVSALSISPDGKSAVSGSWDKTIQVWDLASGQVIYTLEIHSGSVSALSISPDGKAVVSASEDKSLKVWDLKSGRVIHSLEDLNEVVCAIAITPDGKTAVSGSLSGSFSSTWSPTQGLVVWKLASGQVIRNLDNHSFSVWDFASIQGIPSLDGHDEPVIAVSISPNGKMAISVSNTNQLKVWDLTSGKILHSQKGDLNHADYTSISPDGKTAVSATWDNTLKAWDLASGQVIQSFKGHSDHIEAVAISSDGRMMASGSKDNTLKVWDLTYSQINQFLDDHGGRAKAIAIDRDVKTAVAIVDNEFLKVWDLASGQIRHILEGHSRWITTVAISPDGKTAVSGSFDETLKVWDLEAGELRYTMEGHSSYVQNVAISPDGKTAISWFRDNTMNVWDLASGQIRHILEGHSNRITTVAISPDGKTAVSGSFDETLKVWDLEAGQVIHTLKNPIGQVAETVSISPDGKTAVSGNEMVLIVWDLTSGMALRTLIDHSDWVHNLSINHLIEHSGWINNVSISPDGNTIVSASINKSLKVWDLKSGRVIHTLEGHTGCIETVAISSDSKIVISGAKDNTLRTWSMGTGLEISSFIGESCMLACAIAPNGRIIVAGESSGRIHILRFEGM